MVSFDQLLKVFWENHDPTQGMRQGNDVGTQYRSAIYYTTEAQRDGDRELAGDVPGSASTPPASARSRTEVKPLGDFYYAEPYHQQYLPRTPTATAASAAPGSAAPSASPRRGPRLEHRSQRGRQVVERADQQASANIRSSS